ncbi:MAG: deoxyadenosine kinase [Gallionellales bacterium RIFCSPLOWO2_12_FULL_57_18]|nr:MAG: deoxyadenosine kinase [Gallionellales bacterium RIFCSPLOWO2_12_FULL_57_18]OGS95059.1 MAG: deoxyadenosine kinase [Gallionellales bacterium RIFCSPLOWO2_02_FULL_57_47]OGT11645.1 MAG: deoxyadenosine kinase [Gallionellales bacterium RIFCSPHIGHO2_02_FULL_57_16]
MFDKCRYVVVEGPVGVGKTSLARRLAQHIAAATLLEKPEENPFLAKFYQDPPRYALATQLFFLFQRGNEVRDMAQMDLFRLNTVADYLFDKDMLFARLNLSDEEFALYQQIYHSLQLQAPVPDLVIYLQAAPETLVGRVRQRNQPYEQTISDAYLFRVAQGYSDFFYHYDAAPVLMVNTERLNFEDGDEDFSLLLQRIEEMRGPREFFSRGD